ncbi:MAG TPA: hydrogenase maturation protease [Aggregatilineales bacterium]|nr:hydrogenase maturation protease [Aggregatilineales bacterium]
MSVLVLGYGNASCGDDGVGWQLGCDLDHDLLLENVQVLARHQLTIELATEISAAELVIFVDASIDGTPGEIRCVSVEPAPASALLLFHHLTPAALMACASALYGVCPPAILLTITGGAFGYGEQFSDAVRKALPRAQALLRALIEGRLSGNDSPGHEVAMVEGWPNDTRSPLETIGSDPIRPVQTEEGEKETLV